MSKMSKMVKGYKTELNNVPSMIYYQNEEPSSFESEQHIQIEYYHETVTLIQGKNQIMILDEYLEDFFKTVIKYRETANNFLNLR